MIEAVSILLAGFQLARDYRRRTPFCIFSAGVLMAIVLPSILFIRNDQALAAAYYVGMFYVVIFQGVFLISSFVFCRKNLHGAWSLEFVARDAISLKRRYSFLLVISLAAFVYGVSKFNLIQLIYADWWDVVHSDSVFTLLGSYLLYSISSVMLVQRGVGGKVLVCLTLLFLVFSIFVLKTRGYLISLLAPLVLFYLFSGGNKGKRNFLYFLGLSSVAIILFIGTRMVRHGGDLSSLMELSGDGIAELWDSSVADGSEAMLVKAFYYFVQTGIDGLPAGFGEYFTLRRILFFVLPTGFFDLKPTEFSYIMHSAYYGGAMEGGLSMHPTIVGDAFGNGGLAGIILYPILLAIGFGFVERKLLSSKAALLFIGPCVFLSMYMVRGAVYNGFVFFIGAILLLHVLIVSVSWRFRVVR